MSKVETPTDDGNSIVDKFKRAFDDVYAVENSHIAEEIDGEGWIVIGGSVILVDKDVTQIGFVDLGTFESTEYVETTTLGDEYTTRCYGFAAGDVVDYINVDFVRTLSNDVFNESYDELKSWAQTTTEETSRYDGVGPVLFDCPNEYNVLVLPVLNRPE